MKKIIEKFTCIERHKRYQIGLTVGTIATFVVAIMIPNGTVVMAVGSAIQIIWVWE